MTKAELVEQVADRADLTKQEALRAVDAVLGTVEDTLRRDPQTAEVLGPATVARRTCPA